MASPKAENIYFQNIVFLKIPTAGVSARPRIDCNNNAIASGRYLYLTLDGRRRSLDATHLLFIQKIRTFHFGVTAFARLQKHNSEHGARE